MDKVEAVLAELPVHFAVVDFEVAVWGSPVGPCQTRCAMAKCLQRTMLAAQVRYLSQSPANCQFGFRRCTVKLANLGRGKLFGHVDCPDSCERLALALECRALTHPSLCQCLVSFADRHLSAQGKVYLLAASCICDAAYPIGRAHIRLQGNHIRGYRRLDIFAHFLLGLFESRTQSRSGHWRR